MSSKNSKKEMAKDPAFLFYPNDWLGGTQTFTRVHKGAYMDLLMAQHADGHMPIEDVQHILGEKDFKDLWPKLQKKFSKDNQGNYFNQKLEDEMIKRKKFTDSRKNNLSHKEDHMGNGDGNVNEMPLILNVPFEDFWNLYEKKVGSREKLEKKWAALKDGERLLVMNHLPGYKEDRPDKKYRKDPATYLNNKSWNDERISNNGTYNKSTPSANGHGKRGTSTARVEGLSKF